MRAQAALGEVNAALQAYARCRTVLADTLGAPPAPRTVELHAALLAKTPQQSQARPPIRYAGGIAYQVVGDGPLDLVFVPSFVTNLGATWDDPTYAGFLRRLASSSRLILFDKRGTGLSDPALDFPTWPPELYRRFLTSTTTPGSATPGRFSRRWRRSSPGSEGADR
jgi:hypothetical protein